MDDRTLDATVLRPATKGESRVPPPQGQVLSIGNGLGNLLRNPRIADGLTMLARVLLAVLFSYAGQIKLFDPVGFLEDIAQYRLIGREVAWLIACFLPPLEVLCAVGLLSKRWSAASAAMIALLMSAFTVALLSAWLRGLDISCGCFGKSDGTDSYPLLLLRDLLLLAAALWVFWRHWPDLNPPPASRESAPPDADA